MCEEEDDDRFERWCEANGVVSVGQRENNDGSVTMLYFRADGTQVDMSDQYPYSAALTPYTRVKGHS